MTLSEIVGEEIISVAICGGSFHSLPGLYTLSDTFWFAASTLLLQTH